MNIIGQHKIREYRIVGDQLFYSFILSQIELMWPEIIFSSDNIWVDMNYVAAFKKIAPED